MGYVGPQSGPTPPPVATPESPRLIFGIFPGMTGTEGASTASAAMTYDLARTEEALTRLQGPGRPFMIRSYAVYKGNGQVETRTPPDVTRYLQRAGRSLDHVLCYRSEDGDIADWTRFVRQTVRELGDRPATLQITEEPNNPNPDTGGDGASPNVRQALVEGVLAAKDEATRRGLPIAVGFCATPSFSPSDDFWPDLATRGGPTFAEALDYVGLDFYPDVFRPIPAAQLQPAVEGVLTHFRTVNLATGGIPAAVPIRITENGWPTGPDRSPERQAEVLKTVVRTIHHLRGALNITHYEFFSLRDPGGEGAGFREFGLVREDYTPKSAFEAYRQLVSELSESG